jgi:histidinol-phosphate aminotransferase
MADGGQLVAKLAALEGVDKDRIVLGSGSAELLNMLALAFCERGQLVCPWPTFGQITSFAERLGCEIRKVAVDGELRPDLDALDAAVTPNTSLLYLCNPNNPTATVVEGARLEAFCARQAERTLVVLDEAYLDFADAGATRSMIGLVKRDANVVVLRTFSKLHGLAGLRVGYAVARPDVTARLKRMQLAVPNVLGLRAASASLDDAGFLASTRAALVADRGRVLGVLAGLGLRATESQGNFVFFQPGMPAAEFARRMREQQVEVGRTFEPLVDWSRVTIGTTAETDFFLEALRRVRA